MEIEPTVADLDTRLRDGGDPVRAAGERRYLKSDLTFYGRTLPEIRRITKRFGKDHPDLTRADLLAVTTGLWDEPAGDPVHERRMLAALLLAQHETLLDDRDLPLIETFVRQSKTWALVDNLAARVAGPLIERAADPDRVLDRWATDADFWVRRTALLAHLGPLTAGRGDFPRFARLADPMLEEREFFIRKAIGWVLRETGRRDPEPVIAWLGPRTHRTSGVTIREAVKWLDAEQRERLLDAYRNKRPAA